MNPILQMLNQNPLMQRVNQVKNMMNGKNPDDVYNTLMQSNPQFRKFTEDIKGKTIEDIAMEYDLDINLLKKLL